MNTYMGGDSPQQQLWGTVPPGGHILGVVGIAAFGEVAGETWGKWREGGV